MSETTLPAKTQGRTLDCPFNFPPPRVAGWLFMCRCQVCNKTAVAPVATVRAGGRFNATLRAGSPRWSSGGNTRHKRARPRGRPTHKLAGAVPRNGCDDRYPRRVRGVQWLMGQVVTGARTSGVVGMLGPPSSHKAGTSRGDRPEERRAPTQRLEGTNPRTGKRYLLTLSATASSSETSANACPR